jgi:hypothetical protein
MSLIMLGKLHIALDYHDTITTIAASFHVQSSYFTGLPNTQPYTAVRCPDLVDELDIESNAIIPIHSIWPHPYT